MESRVDTAHNQGCSISELIEKREKNPRRAAALVRARKKIAGHIEDAEVLSLARLRLSKGLSQQMVANAMGVKQPYIARIERGEDDIKISTIMNLSKALSESPATIFQIIESAREARENSQ